MNFFLTRRPSAELTIVGVAIFLTIFANFSFFSRVLKAFPLATHTMPVASLALVASQVLLLGLLAIGRATKGVFRDAVPLRAGRIFHGQFRHPHQPRNA